LATIEIAHILDRVRRIADYLLPLGVAGELLDGAISGEDLSTPIVSFSSCRAPAIGFRQSLDRYRLGLPKVLELAPASLWGSVDPPHQRGRLASALPFSSD